MRINTDVQNRITLNQIAQKKRILVAPLHWGLGHATRCIPIINALINYNFEPIIASDGNALNLLRKEFPDLEYYKLPSYNITYSKKGRHLKFKLIKDSLKIIKTINKEKKVIDELIKTKNINGIISDNRFGVRHKTIPSVFITHQLNVLSGNTTWLSSKIHQNIIAKFDQCWVPDYKDLPNLSGDIGHLKKKLSNIKYIGPLSRLRKQELEKTIDILVILSGPEPQRTLLEKKLIFEFNTYKGTVILVKGLVSDKQLITKIGSIKTYNYMISDELETAINTSKLVVSRSGYTTIMDLAKLGKKAIFIPTPGQFEQLYLAKKLSDDLVIPSFFQDKFTAENLKLDPTYSGFSERNYETDFENLFRLF